jgi:hypothetical protein
MGKAGSILIICLLLLILIPVSAIQSPPTITTEYTGAEAQIMFDHEITFADWLSLEERGLVPLRQVTKNVMLVWVDSEEIPLLSKEFNLEMVNDLEKFDAVILIKEDNLRFGNYRVLLEPHLPLKGVLQVLEVLKSKNLEIKKYYFSRIKN